MYSIWLQVVFILPTLFIFTPQALALSTCCYVFFVFKARKKKIQMSLKASLCPSASEVGQWDWDIAAHNTYTWPISRGCGGRKPVCYTWTHSTRDNLEESGKTLCASSAWPTKTFHQNLRRIRIHQSSLWGNVPCGFSQHHESGSVRCMYSIID